MNKSHVPVQKVLSLFVFIGLALLLCFGAGGSPVAHAQEAATPQPGKLDKTIPPGGIPVGSTSDQAAASAPTDGIIIKYIANTNAYASPTETQQMQRLNDAAGIPLTYFRAMSGDANVLRLPERLPLEQVLDISKKLMTLPEVEYAEPDLISFPLLTPNDPRYTDQWDLFGAWGINAPAAWDITTGSSSIVVADIDTGITNHVDLSGRTVPGYDFIADVPTANDGNGRDSDPSDPGDWVAANECYAGSSAQTSSWHGTHTAGTIGASGNNSLGIAGINWVSKILPIRVLGKCGGYTSDIVDGMRWSAGLSVSGVSVNLNPARVLNMSLGGSGACGATTQSAVNEITAAGAVIVVSAGNSNADASGFNPANCSGVITVAATDKNGYRAPYSNYGSIVKISAPGGAQSVANDPAGILSTLNTGTASPVADTYIYYQGTSMSAPHVSGVVSLMLSVNPSLTPAQVLQKLQSSVKAFPVGGTCNTSNCGSGILDAGAAVSASVPPSSPPGAFVKTSPTNGAIGQSTSPTLLWGASSGATSYEYCYDTTPDNACTTSWVSTGTTASANLSGLSPSTAYYWQVRANNGNGTTYANGSLTAYWSFTTGTGGNNDDFNTPIIISSFPYTNTQATSAATTAIDDPVIPCSLDLIQYNNTVWYRYTAGSSATVTFDTVGSDYDTILAIWTGSRGSLVSAGCNDDISISTLQSEVAITPTTGVTYYIEVASFSSGGGSLTLNATGGATTPPGAFGKTSPTNGAISQSTSPTLSWGASSGAASYEYCYDTTPDNACTTSWVSTGTGTSANLSGLSVSTTYYWQVRANNGNGTTYAEGSDIAYWSFTTGTNPPPGAFGKTSPSNGASGKSTSLLLSWGASSTATSYEYCYDTSNDDACSSSWVSTGTTASANLSGLSPSTTYYWQVRANNGNGTTYANGIDTAYWSFTTATPVTFINLLQDPSFENSIGTSAYWTQASTNYGTPLCTLTACTGANGTAAPRTGSVWGWLGGTSKNEVSSLSQTVTIPSGFSKLKLQFYLWIGTTAAGSDAADVFTAKIDGGTVFSANATQRSSYPGYTLVSVNASAFSDDGLHTIAFSSVTTGQRVDFNLDDVAMGNATFFDVPINHWAWAYIERLYNAGITNGCSASPLAYCPANTVTRAEMAVFLLRGKYGSTYNPPPVGTSTGFSDVPITHWAAAWIKQLAVEGITNGCGTNLYCPANTVNRAEMAVFLLRATHGSTYTPPPVGTSTGFNDVPLTHWAAAWIKQLALEGITSGCGPSLYCPSATVNRSEMAAFLVRALSLP